MKNKGLLYLAGAIMLLYLFRDIINTKFDINIPDIGGFIGNLASDINVPAGFNNNLINDWIDRGVYASAVYRWYEAGYITYQAGFRYLNNEYADVMGDSEFSVAADWAAGQLEEYANYGN